MSWFALDVIKIFRLFGRPCDFFSCFAFCFLFFSLSLRSKIEEV